MEPVRRPVYRPLPGWSAFVVVLLAVLAAWGTRPLASGDEDTALLALRADELWERGHFAESEAMARLVLARDEDEALGHLVLARSLAARLALDEAVVEARRAIADDPFDPAAYDLLAEIFTRLGLVPEATSALSRYLSLLPASARDVRAIVRRAELRVLWQLRDRAAEAGEHPVIFSCDDASSVVLPIEIHDSRPFVRGRINGGDEQLFLVDTGADRTVIDPTTAVAMGLETVVERNHIGSLTLAAIDSLRLGGLELRHVLALVRSSVPASSMSGGLVLSPLALGLSMSVDYAREELTIGQLLPEEAADVVIPMWFPGLPMVRGEIEGNRYMFIVDTGAVLLSVDTLIAGDVGHDPVRRVPLRVRDAWGRIDPDAALMIPGPAVTFGSLVIAGDPIGIRNLSTISRLLGYRVGGLIGGRILSRYRVTFDLARRQLRLTHRRD